MGAFEIINLIASFVIVIIGCSMLWSVIQDRDNSSGSTEFDQFVDAATGVDFDTDNKWQRRALHWDTFSVLMIWVISACATGLRMKFDESLLRLVLIVFSTGLFAYMVIQNSMTKFSLLNMFRILNEDYFGKNGHDDAPSEFKTWFGGIVFCYVGAMYSLWTPLSLNFGENGKFLRLVTMAGTGAAGVVGLISFWTSAAAEYGGNMGSVGRATSAMASASVELVLLFFTITAFCTTECVYAFSIMFLAGYRGFFLLSDLFKFLGTYIGNNDIDKDKDQITAAYSFMWLSSLGAILFALALWRSYEDQRKANKADTDLA